MDIKQLVDSIATDVVERAQLNLGVVRTINGKKRRRVASGSLQKGLSYKNLTRYNNPIIQFGVDSPELKNYADVIEFGRRKGARKPPVGPIIEWMNIKGIRPRAKDGGFLKLPPTAEERAALQRNIAWAISTSIGKNGIEGIRYYGDALKTVLEKRGDEFFAALGKEIETRLNLK
jgi:hypothetical protein